MSLKNYLKETEGPSLQAFEKLVERHDLTYSYSDDQRSWRRGEDSMKAILEMRDALIKEDPANEAKVVEIWNKNVDKCIVQNQRSQWYWKTK